MAYKRTTFSTNDLFIDHFSVFGHRFGEVPALCGAEPECERKAGISVKGLASMTCPRTFIQRQLESRVVLRRRARCEQHAIGGAGWGCAADRMLREGSRRRRPASDSPAPSAVVAGCRTRFENAHKTACGKVLYRLHPWSGREVSLLHRDFGNELDRWISFDHAIRTNFARPSSFIRLRDLTAIATSVVRRASWRDFMVSPMTRL